MIRLIKVVNHWKEVILITLLFRGLLFLYSSIINPESDKFFLYSWVRWDGPHYIDLAKNWYQTQGEQGLWIVFYPLYPLFIKIFYLFTNDYYIAAIFTSTFFSFTASIFLYELILLDYKKKTAILAVWFLNIFPTSYFLQASYSESLFLTTALATIYFIRKNLFFYACLFGILTTATRVSGILLLPVMLLELKLAQDLFKTRFNFETLKKALVLLITPIGFVFYLLINYQLFSDPFYFQKPLALNWYKSFEYPWVSLQNLKNSIPQPSDGLFYAWSSELIFFVSAFLISIAIFFLVRKSYGIYMLLNLILFSSTSFIMSTPRYVIILFPIYLFFALLNNKYILPILSLLFLALLYYFSTYYIKGQWAF